MSVSRRLAVLIPCVGPEHLSRKLADFTKLGVVVDHVVLCFNGPPGDLEAVAELARQSPVQPCRVSKSEPYRKAAALNAGLELAQSDRILFSDVDCFLRGEPDITEVQRLVAGDDVIAFPVLRRPRSNPRQLQWTLARRHAVQRTMSALGLYYIGVRGGGYIAGDLRGSLPPQTWSDDMVGPANWAARRGSSIVASHALIFEELPADRGGYVRKLPRLIYGSFQAVRLSPHRRVKASIAIMKLAKYVLVAASPLLALAGLALLGLPLWLPLLLLLPLARTILLTWEGIVRGVLDRPPTW